MCREVETKAIAYSRDEVAKHCKDDDCWIIVDGQVYDVTRFKHPGGRVVMLYAGQDASDAVHALHPDAELQRKYLKTVHIGALADSSAAALEQDFAKIRQSAEEAGLFRAKPYFYIGWLAHIVVMEIVAAWCVSWHTRLGWWVGALLLATAQIQAGWLQHDFGHLSVFKKSKWNHLAHWITVCHMKGASATWWNARHFRHHAKPNVVGKDLDIAFSPLFVLGNMKNEGKGWIGTAYQHWYWWLLGPPAVTTILFHVEVLIYIFARAKFVELAWMLSFFVRWMGMLTYVDGLYSAWQMYWAVRFIESLWFGWVTSMSHLPMKIDADNQPSWFKSQLQSTLNVHPGWFNDWFTGHLNYQIEHHLFPTMPRHNYSKIQPAILALAKKHGVHYKMTTLLGAFAAVPEALREAGTIAFDMSD